MSISSMTGYGRAEGEFEDASWVWEVRAVNGKSLDMRLRLPHGFESMDPGVRKIVSKALSRGNLQINLTLHSTKGVGSFAINEALLASLVETGAGLVKEGKVEPSRLDGLYRVHGVVTETIDLASDTAHKERNAAILTSLEDMLSSLVSARTSEGKALETVLNDVVVGFETQLAAAKNSAGAQAGHIKEQFDMKFAELTGDKLPAEKLAQEAALLALKADVREELDRLDAHIAQAKILIAKGSPIGRKLDFLSQEFIREINTLCSKSSSIDLTQIGLSMKSLIEQFREQAANVE